MSVVPETKSVKAIIFDVDGTLLDTEEFIYAAVRHVISEFKLPKGAWKQIQAGILRGITAHDLYREFKAYGDPDEMLEVHQQQQEQQTHQTTVYQHVAETLAFLHEQGFKLAAVSNRKRTVLQTLDHHGLTKYFDVIIPGDAVTKHKPHPELITTALEQLGIRPEKAIMVGDSESDVLAGRAAQVATVAVSYGWGDAPGNKPDYVVHSLQELRDLLEVAHG